MPVEITKRSDPPKKKKQGQKKTLVDSKAKERAEAKTPEALEKALRKHHGKSDAELQEAIDNPAYPERSNYKLSKEQREQRMVLFHRLMMRKATVAQICETLKISTGMYYSLREQLKERVRIDQTRVDLPYLMGDSLALFDEVRSMALNISSSSKEKTGVKLRAMSVALQAEREKNEFLSKIGVYQPSIIERIVERSIETHTAVVSTGNGREAADAILRDIVTGLTDRSGKLVEPKVING